MSFDIRDYLSGLAANAAGVSNVVMQLSWPGVGYGVKDSKVYSGSAMHHPVKRARTTFTYLAVSMLGDERDRQVFRKAVNGQHAQVRSAPGDEVQYSAMDPELQLWVAACLYYGTVDLVERFQGRLDDATADALYEHCARFGTSLQVRQDMWPPSRAAFSDYWEESLKKVHVDDAVRAYLVALIRYENAPRLVQRLFAEHNELRTVGFLPPLFREQLGLPWDDEKQARFDRHVARLAAIDRRLPRAVRTLPFTLLLRDMRRRHRKGIPLV